MVVRDVRPCGRFVVRRDWNFAGSGKPATTFLKFLVLRIAGTT
jgi:hypothetical protein